MDEQYSTSFITDNSGKIENRYTYDAFGNTLESQENVHNRIKYTGQQYDPVTQQYYLRARFYNPILGRFMQEDVYRGDGLNLYAYCENNPVMYYDPSGYATQKELVKNIGSMTDDQKRQALSEQYNQFIQNKKDNNKIKVSMDDLELDELTTNSYKEMNKTTGDGLTPHHMPSANSLDINNDNITYNAGTCLNVREDTHRLTFTYGMNENSRPYDSALYNSLSYEERLKFDHENIKEAYSLQRPNVDSKRVDEAMKNYKNNNPSDGDTEIKSEKCS